MDRRTKTIIICVILLASAVGVGFFYYSQNSNDVTTSADIIAPVSPVNTSATKNHQTQEIECAREKEEVIMDTSGWEKYEEEDYNYQIMYPSDWEILKTEEGLELNEKGVDYSVEGFNGFRNKYFCQQRRCRASE